MLLLVQPTALEALLTAAVGAPSSSLPHAFAVLGLALVLTWCARLSRRQTGRTIYGKLVLLALAQAGLAGLQLLAEAGGLQGGIVAAGQSLLELSLLALFLVGARRLQQLRLLGASRLLLLTGAALAAVFCGLVGPRTEQSLLGASWLAVGGHALFLLLFAASLCRGLVNELRRECNAAAEKVRELTAAGRQLEERAAETGRAATENARLYSEQKGEAVQLRQRARTLERILAVSARINATRTMSELLEQVVEAVREILGFRMVLLRLYSPSTQAFEARAFAGIPEDGKAYLAGIQVALSDYQKMTQPRFQVSNSYFLSHEDEGAAEVTEGAYVPDLGPRSAGEWHEDDALIIPLISPTGETKGYLSVDDPADRRIPTLATIRQLEFLARQAATAIESAEVYDRLAKNNSELAQASEMLNSLAEMKSNFIANVSHELRTPLTSITAYAEILQQGSDGMPDEVRREFLRVIHKESEKLSGIVDDILDLSRMEGGPTRVERGETDLAALVRRLEETARGRAGEQGITLRVEAPAEVRLEADGVLLQQLVDHLLSNALKFTTGGGTVRLLLEDGGARVRLVVEDTGIGIPEEKMRYIFDRFYQADGSSTREHGGQGIGLALCRDIVDYHEGRIWAENVPTGGARFQVVLPRRGRVIQRLSAGVRASLRGDPAEFLEQLVRWIATTMEVEMVSLMAPAEDGEHLEILAATGLTESVVQSTRVRKNAGIVGKVWASGRTLHVDDITTDPRLGKRQNDPRYYTPSLLCVPILEGLEVTGVISVNNRRDRRPLDDEDRLLLEALAQRVGFLLQQYRAQLVSGRRFASLQESLRSTMTMLRHRHDEITALCQRACLATARRLKLPPPELEHLAFALQYYDVGLVRVPDQLLRKATELTAEERQEIRTHVPAGLEILGELQVSPKVRQIVLHHHERFDAGGYPDGLEGEAIPIGARLLALADSLNAMLQGRPYRPRRDFATAAAEIRELAGKQFCPRLAEMFLGEASALAGEFDALQAQAARRENAVLPAPHPLVPECNVAAGDEATPAEERVPDAPEPAPEEPAFALLDSRPPEPRR